MGSAHTNYSGGHLLESGWFAGYLVMALAGGRVEPLSEADLPADRLPTKAMSLLPYAALLVASSTALVDLLTGHHPGLVEVILIGLLVATVLERQGVAVLESSGRAGPLPRGRSCSVPCCRARAT